MSVKQLVVAPRTPNTPIIGNDPLRYEWLTFFNGLATAVNEALNILGQFDGVIGPNATVAGHVGTLQANIQNLNASGLLAASALTGIVAPTQLPAALDTAQGAVVLPVGAPSNVLGSAAFTSSTDYDPAGAAATAQANAEAASDPLGSAAAALTNAKAYTDAKFPGVTAHTIPLAKLTGLGANGSITFDANGVVTGFVDPT